MRRSLAALAVVAAAAILASGCGGGGDDEAGGPTTTASTTTTRDPVDVSTPEAVVAALADAGINCENLQSQGSADLAVFGIDGTQSLCTLDGNTVNIAVVTSDQELSDVHQLLTDFTGVGTDANGNTSTTTRWVEVQHTVVIFEAPPPDEEARLAQIQRALGGRIESVSV
jgi:hypothetical protein